MIESEKKLNTTECIQKKGFMNSNSYFFFCLPNIILFLYKNKKERLRNKLFEGYVKIVASKLLINKIKIQNK